MAQHLASKLDMAHVFYKLIQEWKKTFRSEAEASSNHDAGGGEGGGGGGGGGGAGRAAGEDEALECRDCGAEFCFTVGEQQFYKEKGFDNKPTRCAECKASRWRSFSWSTKAKKARFSRERERQGEGEGEEEEEQEDTMKTGSTGGFSGTDETLKCRECSADFVFTVGAQAFYTARGLKHKPVRCRQCRAPQPKNP